jgi:hypothetical protein
MTIVRSLCVSSIPIEHEPEPLFEENDLSVLSARDGTRPSDELAAPALEDVTPLLLPGDFLDASAASVVLSILATQVNYRKALLESPDRAPPAIVLEIKSLFGDKKPGRPVCYRDIPVSVRKFNLRSLDGYKENYGPDDDWIKSKARIFVDGSRQHPDYTTESSSRVDRIESVFMLASIAAYRGWEVIKFDVVSGYPKYRRISKGCRCTHRGTISSLLGVSGSR